MCSGHREECCVQPFDHDRQYQETITHDVVATFLQFWEVQDVAETVALLTPDIYSVVYLDLSAGGMSGEKIGRDAVAEGLYNNLATWHYLKFDWKIIGVAHNTVRAQVDFEYLHQKTKLSYAGSMRMVFVVTDGMISRVECHHDGPRIVAFMKLVAEREAQMRIAEAEARLSTAG
jgi:ketosteroid isomerase-like protein